MELPVIPTMTTQEGAGRRAGKGSRPLSCKPTELVSVANRERLRCLRQAEIGSLRSDQIRSNQDII